MGLLAALQFLTRVPIRLRREPSLTAIVVWFPLAGALIACQAPIAKAFAGWRLHDEATLAALALVGAVVYGCAVLALFGAKIIGQQPALLDDPAALSAAIKDNLLWFVLLGPAGAIAYRAHPATYALGRLLVRVEYLGIANLLLKEAMYPEYIQGAATPAALAAELRSCLHDPAQIGRAHV